MPGLRRAAFAKQVTAAGFQLKGSGWYVTDFRGGKPGGQAGKPTPRATPKPAADERRRRSSDAKGGDGRSRAGSKPTADAGSKAPTARGAGGGSPAPRRRRASRHRRSGAAAASLRSPRRPAVKKYLIAGLLVWLPLAVTIWVLHAVLGVLDGVFAWLLSASQAVLPDRRALPHRVAAAVPGLGVLVMLAGLLLTGIFATNIVGQWWLRQGGRVLSKIPIVKSIYSSVKQVSDTLFSSSGNAFREAVLVQYPRQGSWTIAFVTGRPGGEAARICTASTSASTCRRRRTRPRAFS